MMYMNKIRTLNNVRERKNYSQDILYSNDDSLFITGSKYIENKQSSARDFVRGLIHVSNHIIFRELFSFFIEFLAV